MSSTRHAFISLATAAWHHRAVTIRPSANQGANMKHPYVNMHVEQFSRQSPVHTPAHLCRQPSTKHSILLIKPSVQKAECTCGRHRPPRQGGTAVLLPWCTLRQPRCLHSVDCAADCLQCWRQRPAAAASARHRLRRLRLKPAPCPQAARAKVSSTSLGSIRYCASLGSHMRSASSSKAIMLGYK